MHRRDHISDAKRVRQNKGEVTQERLKILRQKEIKGKNTTDT